ncbi:MAG: ATP-dependent DNA helicase RecG [Gammaproteobacteria bacterium]|nr:ATP-dependent DNA helicase RecG [Gammaproteobacteria bacterium]
MSPAYGSSASTATPAHRLDVTTLKGVGPSMAERLQRLRIQTVQDLLFHLPSRYQDRTRITPIGALRPGDEVVVEGEVQGSEVKFGRRRMLLTHISDGSGGLTLRFFHFNSAQQQSLSPGTRLRCFGEVRSGVTSLEMVHPEFRRLAPGAAGSEAVVEEHLTPIYPTTEGLQMPGLRKLIDQALTLLQEGALALPDLIPTALLPSGMGRLRESLLSLHRPTPDIALSQLSEGGHPAQQRLAFEELLAHQLSLRLLRQRQRLHVAPALRAPGPLVAQLQARLPFALTGAQQRVLDEIRADLQQPTPMQRLVQGDVGCGKTIVAALAALQAVESGLQAAVMAPTELLAEQHYQSLRGWLEPLGLKVAWLTGRLTAKARREMLAAIESGTAVVAVGTHALFQQEATFRALGLVIVDEQHRFGVHQRLALREKGVQADGSHPHQLIMTATPIPRTLAMTAYADLDLSVIDELPPGRTPVETVAISDERRDEVVQRVAAACAEGRQAYWVCTLIEESESLQCQAAEESVVQLRQQLPQLRIGLIHGRMKGAQKEQAMNAFKQGELELLVATTVIEVGVDVPNASLMIIENAERLGLAQLHQLRGRVGRGSTKSSCVLMYHPPISQQARERLGVLRESNDGFVIARKDLELRGPGEVLGTRQTGMLQLRIADLQRDQALLAPVGVAAQRLLQEYPQQVTLLLERWLGERQRYGDV